jgi:DNA-binding CsgD family transcriptional regulator
MTRLSASDLRAALDFVGEAHSFEDLDSFRVGILPGLAQLVPADLVGYNEVDPGNGDALVVLHPDMAIETGEVLSRLAHQHPLISLQLSEGDLRTYKISDFLTRREFHSLELYDELYRVLGAEDQIAFGLPGPTVIGIAMNRGRRDFSERDRELLDLLRPHLAQAYRRILDRVWTGARLAALEGGVERDGTGVLILDRNGSIAVADDASFELLGAYFPDERRMSLPAEIRDWLAGGGDRDPLRIGAERGWLTVREAPAGAWAAQVLVLREERAMTPASLLALGRGLTHRQAEILCLLVGGESTAEIAAALFISPSTVRKHCEHIYERLGVHSRTAAVAAALRGWSLGA